MPWMDTMRGTRLEECAPVRPFAVQSGRRIAPGWWWSATDGQLVRYGSGVMRTQVIRLDHDPQVVAMACRPVELIWREADGSRVRHAPHLMARLADGSGLLLDCAGHDEISRRLAHRAKRVAAAAGSVGWEYRIARPPDPVVAANLKWLAGYRHPRYRGGELAGRVVDAFLRPRSLIEGAREVGDPVEVLPVVFHALWNGALSARLLKPLHEQVTVSSGQAGQGAA